MHGARSIAPWKRTARKDADPRRRRACLVKRNAYYEFSLFWSHLVLDAMPWATCRPRLRSKGDEHTTRSSIGDRLQSPGRRTNVSQRVISAVSLGSGFRPYSGKDSNLRHSVYWRRLQDLPVQSIPVIIRLRVARLRCRNAGGQRQILAERVSGFAEPRLRCRVGYRSSTRLHRPE
jgi:hypothetical protein